jgi:hypothetical protein
VRREPRKTVRFIAFCLAAAGFLPVRNVCAETPRLAEPALARQLAGRVTLAWHGQGIGPALARLAQVQQLPIWIDRRVDPHAAIELAVENVPLDEALDQLVASHDEPAWGWTTLGTVVYFGPRTAARDLATVTVITRQQLAKAPADVRTRWLAPSPWTIPRLSEPRALLRETLTPLGASIANEGDMPHDVWVARDLPEVAPVDRVVLLLAGFDLGAVPSADGQAWRLVPIKRPVRLSREYASNARTEEAVAARARDDSELEVQRGGRRLIVAGRWEDHELLRAAIRGEQAEPPRARRPRGGGEQRFTLRIENQPAGRVLEQLASQLQLTLVWEAGDAARDAAVSCDVHEADLDALLQAVTSSAGLGFVHEAETVTIRATR